MARPAQIECQGGCGALLRVNATGTMPKWCGRCGQRKAAERARERQRDGPTSDPRPVTLADLAGILTAQRLGIEDACRALEARAEHDEVLRILRTVPQIGDVVRHPDTANSVSIVLH